VPRHRRRSTTAPPPPLLNERAAAAVQRMRCCPPADGRMRRCPPMLDDRVRVERASVAVGVRASAVAALSLPCSLFRVSPPSRNLGVKAPWTGQLKRRDLGDRDWASEGTQA